MALLSDQAERLIDKVVGNNADAKAFFVDMVSALHFWDDLIDRDHELSDGEINFAMEALLLRIPMNAFYQQYAGSFYPVLVMAIANWKAANSMEREAINGNDLYIAFILRSSYVDLLSLGAIIIHGQEKANEFILEIRRTCSAEGFNAYLNNLADEKSTRQQREVAINVL